MKKIYTWFAKMPDHAFSCFTIMILVAASALLCNSLEKHMEQRDALKLIHNTYVQSKNGCTPITYRQTQAIDEAYYIATSGLSDSCRQLVDSKIEAITEAYYEHQESLCRDRDGLFAPNDDPGPGVYTGNNGYKADIRTPFIPPARTANGEAIQDNPAGHWSGPSD